MSRIGVLGLGFLLAGCGEPTSPSRLTLDLGEGVTMEFVLIPAGEFLMGSERSEERPVHRVRIEKPFYMGVTEVTNAQLRRARPEFDSNDPRGGANIPYQKYIKSLKPELNGDRQPAVYIPWEEAVAFTIWLSRESGRVVRLPAEAEWEYACRAGTITLYSWGNDPRSSHIYANTNDPVTEIELRLASGFPVDDGFRTTAPVGSFEPNPFGLFDMHGNVAEWTADQWHENYLGAPGDGRPWLDSLETGERVVRGGSFESSPNGEQYFSCRCSGRSWNFLGNRNFGTGFRAVVETGSR